MRLLNNEWLRLSFRVIILKLNFKNNLIILVE